MTPPVGIIVGSNRRASINRRLAKALAHLIADRVDVHWIAIDDLPMYNQDLEDARPDVVHRFTGEIARMTGLLFVTPEHNRSIPAVLKNAIDWGARPWGKTSWPGRPAAVIGTSGGVISTAVAQQHLKAVLNGQGLNLIGGEAYVQFKPEMIDGDANVPDETVRGFLKGFVDRFTDFAGKLAPRARQAAA